MAQLSRPNSLLIYRIMLHSYGNDLWEGCGKNEEGRPYRFSEVCLSTWFLAESLHHDLYLCERLVSS